MQLHQLIPQLWQARLQSQPLEWPTDTPADLGEGYAAALAVRQDRIRHGETPVGYKIGFTNRTIWPRYQVYAPIWGTMWDTTLAFYDSRSPVDAPAGELSLQGLCEPRIEPEIVFALREAPPADCTLAQLAASIAWVAHGFEIVHTHFPGWKFTAAQGVADGSLHGRMLVGPQVAVPSGASPDSLDALAKALSGLQLKLFGDGVLKDQGVGANVLDGPLQALLYFVQELRALPGAPVLQSGDIITTGTVTDAWPVRAGQKWHTGIEAAGPLANQLRGLTVRFT